MSSCVCNYCLCGYVSSFVSFVLAEFCRVGVVIKEGCELSTLYREGKIFFTYLSLLVGTFILVDLYP